MSESEPDMTMLPATLSAAKTALAVAKDNPRLLTVVLSYIPGFLERSEKVRDYQDAADLKRRLRTRLIENGVADAEESAAALADAIAACEASKLEFEQGNLRGVLKEAAAASSASSVSHSGEQEYDHAFYAEFFSKVTSVSAPEMQRLWGRVLARKTLNESAANPSAVRILRDMSVEDTRCLLRLAAVRLDASNIVLSGWETLQHFKSLVGGLRPHYVRPTEAWKEFYQREFASIGQISRLEELGVLRINNLMALQLQGPAGAAMSVDLPSGALTWRVPAKGRAATDVVGLEFLPYFRLTDDGKALMDAVEPASLPLLPAAAQALLRENGCVDVDWTGH